MASITQTLAPEYVENRDTLSDLAVSVLEGLGASDGKRLSPQFFYDDLGSALFEAITVLPEYGLTRADERILVSHADEISSVCGPLFAVAELGSGSGKKTAHVLRAASRRNAELCYFPIDVSAAALNACEREISPICAVRPTCADWSDGLARVSSQRSGRLPLLLLFLGSSIGNLDRESIPMFLRSLRAQLKPGDFLLLGADLEKDVSTMLAAYDDPTGVTAAFNLNLLARINRELGSDFDLRSFRHEARWNSEDRRIEMHLVSLRDQNVLVPSLKEMYSFSSGESIWTESSHKFAVPELEMLAQKSGFLSVNGWTDQDWPLAEVLWQAA